MKSLRQYLKELNEGKQYRFVYPLTQSFDDFMKYNNLNEDTITNDACNWFAENCWDKRKYLGHIYYSDNYPSPLPHINEMLKTSTINVLLKALSKELCCGIYIDNSIEQNNNDDRSAKQLCVYSQNLKIDKIVELCDKYMWSLTSVCILKNNEVRFRSYKEATNDSIKIFSKNDKGKYYKICVEPIQSEIVTPKVKSTDNKVYHICTKDNLQSILKSGLRPKGENNGYRFIKNKVYLFYGKTKVDKLNAIKEICWSKFNMTTSRNKILYDNAVILEIDFSDYDIDFYRDTFYDNKNIIYTYAYFPPKMLKEISYEEFD